MFTQTRFRTIHVRMAALRKQITGLEYVCSGTLILKKLPCGQDYCRCKKGPAYHHGPYYYWHRVQQGRLVSRVMSLEQARLLRMAIKNYRRAKRILKKWERETIKLIQALKEASRR